MRNSPTFLKVTHGTGDLQFHSLVNLDHITRVIVAGVTGKVTLELSDTKPTISVNEPAQWFEDVISGHPDDIPGGIYEYKG